MKKLVGYDAKLIKSIIHEEDAVIEIDDKQYHLSLIEESRTTVDEDISDPELKQKIQQTKRDILAGRDFAIDDVVEMMDKGKL